MAGRREERAGGYQQDVRAALEHYQLYRIRETGKELGRGSYAAVIEVDYKGMRCAAKKIYNILRGEGDRLVERFEEECRLLGTLRHPHIVQFLGTYFDPATGLPVLVMEFLPATLAQCVDRYGRLPAEICYAILRGVALGLRYLHEQRPRLIHRDLSANNVLLTGDMSAKISDLGVAKILQINPAEMSHMTQTPGTQSYMPPEALRPDPRYDIEVDVFSFGVMVVHVLSGQWPFPSEATQVDPCNPAGIIGVSEVDRRAQYLEVIGRPSDEGEGHPLMALIERCLSNSPNLRPNALELVDRMSDVSAQRPLTFSNRVDMMQRIDSIQRDKEALQTRVSELEGQVEQCQETIVHAFSPNASLVWRKCASIPVEMAGAKTTSINGTVYVGGTVAAENDSHQYLVFKYDPVKDEWTTLPPAPVKLFGVGQLNGKLVIVGGGYREVKNATGDVHVFKEDTQQWVKSIPPMPRGLAGSIVVSHSSSRSLVVCGTLNTSAVVLVYSSQSSQWHWAAALPFTFNSAYSSAVVVNDTYYMAVGIQGILDQESNPSSPAVFSLPLSTLLDPNAPQGPSIWQRIPDTPCHMSHLAATGGCLLALGGLCNVCDLKDHEADAELSTAVHAYCPATFSWIKIGDLPAPLSVPAIATLPFGELFMAGGLYCDEHNFSQKVFKGSIR